MLLLRYPVLSRQALLAPCFVAAASVASCQPSVQAPPPGETPQSVSPVVTAPALAVAPATAAPVPIPAQKVAAERLEAAPVKNAPIPPTLPGAVRVHQLANTTRAQCAITGLGAKKGHIKGSLLLTELKEGGISITGVITGLTPGRHGFHVHEHGNCGSADGMSAGGHFNPTKAPHGATEATDSHVGDLGNIEADASGKATIDLIKRPASLTAGPSSFLGRSFIVHAGADDLTSQPAGDSGPRVGCGVIKPMT